MTAPSIITETQNLTILHGRACDEAREHGWPAPGFSQWLIDSFPAPVKVAPAEPYDWSERGRAARLECELAETRLVTEAANRDKFTLRLRIVELFDQIQARDNEIERLKALLLVAEHDRAEFAAWARERKAKGKK